MKREKLIAVISAICLAAGLMACGGADETAVNNGSENTPTSQQEQASNGEAVQADAGTWQNNGETVNLEWFMSAGVVPQTWDTNQYVMGQITEKTGVTISADIPAEDADTKLNLLIASGQLPDIITTTNSTLIKDMIDADLVWPLQEFFETYLPDSHIINDSNESFPEDIKEQLILRDGDWYSFPSHILSAENREKWGLPDATRELWESTDYRNNGGVIFNKTIMDELGITEEDVSTESGLLEAFEKVKNAGLEVNGGKVTILLANGKAYNGTGWQCGNCVATLANFFGAMPVDENGTYQSLYRTEGFRHAMKFLNTCAKQGYVDANQFTMDDAAIEAECRSGRVFCFIGNTASTGFALEGEWFTPGVILSDGGETPVLGINQKVTTGWLQNFVSKDTKNPEAVARFIDFMSSKEGLILWNYGEPEIDWTYNEDNLIVRTEEGTEKSSNANVTGVGAFWAFCNQNFDQSIMDPSNDGGIVPQCAYGKNPATYVYDSQALSLPGAYIEGNEEMNTITVEIKNYVTRQLADIILHAVDEEDFNARMQELTDQLDKLGLGELEAYIDEAVQANYKELGVVLKAVN